MKTLQEIHNQVRDHLLAQNARSEDGSQCAYRGECNTRCAVGCLIKDEFYSPEIEGVSVHSGAWEEALSDADEFVWDALKISLQKSDVPTDEATLNYLRQLQIIHDEGSIVMWEKTLQKLALKNNLIP